MTHIDIDPRIKSIGELIEDLRSGKYYLPSFQRRWEWNADKIKDFIDSILRRYPIGVIILWEPSRDDVDPFSKPLVGDETENTQERYYILDGQQRLTALLLMFNNWRIKRQSEEIVETPISYNPANGKLYKGRRGVDLSTILRAFNLFDPEAQDEIRKDYPSYIDKLRMLAQKITTYRIPIYIILTSDEDENISKDMAEAFIRVNKYGVRIRNIELMLSYLGGGVGGEFVSRIRYIHNKLENEVGLELEPLLRFLFSNFGLKQTQISKVEHFKKSVNTIKEKMSEAPEIFRKSEEALNVLVKFLKSLGITDLGILPSQIALLPILKFFYIGGISDLNNLNNSEIKNIESWFVLASFNGYYSSSPDTKLEKDLETILNSSSFPFKELKKNMESKRAKTTISYDDLKKGLNTNVLKKSGRNYLFLLYLLLVKNNADDWTGRPIKECNMRDLDKHHIFPKDYLRENKNFETDEDEEKEVNCIGNITFINRLINIEIGDTPPIEYLPKYFNELEKHFIPDNEYLWTIDNYESFLEKRLELIYYAGKKYFKEIFSYLNIQLFNFCNPFSVQITSFGVKITSALTSCSSIK